MPSNYTPNYSLNQWSAEDRVLRTDFNADNAKIDAAIKTQADAISAEVSARTAAVQAARDACPLVLLKSVTLSASSDSYSLSLTGFHWEDYGEVILYAFLKPAATVSNLTVQVNGVSGSGQYYVNGSEIADNLNTIRVEYYGASAVCRILRSAVGFQTLWWDSSHTQLHHFSQIRDSSAQRSTFRTMNFTGGLGSGTRFTLLGVRG